ncbi:HAD-IIB family hydrolase [Candidatus Parcubacteria bacterium]|nr:HAD-IIB family hydrolase [Candidatus Parcubacteria bacterium]
MKKVIAFDLDDTLSESKSQADDRMVELLARLLEKYHVCVISGGKLEQFKKQLPFITNGAAHQLENMHLMPTCGTKYFVYDLPSSDWELVYAEDFAPEQKKKIIGAIKEALDETNLWPKKQYGELIEDRGSQVTVSAVGQEAPVDVKKAWDPDDIKKYQLRDAIAKKIPEFEVRAGGMTSIDVTKQGIDKAFGMRKLMEILDVDKSDILFFGDKLHEGGNDYPVKALGIDSVAVRNWEDTALALEVVLAMSD